MFGSCIIHSLYTECAKIKKKNYSGAKRLIYLEGQADLDNHFPDKWNSTVYGRRWQYNVTPLATVHNSVTSRLVTIFTLNTTSMCVYIYIYIYLLVIGVH